MSVINSYIALEHTLPWSFVANFVSGPGDTAIPLPYFSHDNSSLPETELAGSWGEVLLPLVDWEAVCINASDQTTQMQIQNENMRTFLYTANKMQQVTIKYKYKYINCICSLSWMWLYLAGSMCHQMCRYWFLMWKMQTVSRKQLKQ